ncbi:MAG: hypothetical protein ABL998_18655 [Planctomycetota bacterium]
MHGLLRMEVDVDPALRDAEDTRRAAEHGSALDPHRAEITLLTWSHRLDPRRRSEALLQQGERVRSGFRQTQHETPLGIARRDAANVRQWQAVLHPEGLDAGVRCGLTVVVEDDSSQDRGWEETHVARVVRGVAIGIDPGEFGQQALFAEHVTPFIDT